MFRTCVHRSRRCTNYGGGVVTSDVVGGLVNTCSAVGGQKGKGKKRKKEKKKEKKIKEKERVL